MGNCESSTEYLHKDKPSSNASNFSSPSLPKVSYSQHKLKKNLSMRSTKYLLPENLAKRDDISKYYNLSKNIISYGSTSLLYVGENKDKEKFAIKRVIKSKSGISKKQKMIIKEAETCLRLNHKNIIKYYEIYEDINFVNIVMELGDTDLFELITKSPNCIIPEELSIEILIQVFDVIDYLHTEEHIVHCDIKPENFVVKFENNYPFLKLIDFGSARKMGTGGESKLKNFCGTKEYIAPEIFENNTFNEKVDEWAAGILMFNLLTGCDPFMNQNNSDYRDNILFKEINFNLIKNEKLRELNKKLLNRYVVKRITAKEALEEIKKIKNYMIKNNIMNIIDKNNSDNYWDLMNKKIRILNLS